MKITSQLLREMIEEEMGALLNENEALSYGTELEAVKDGQSIFENLVNTIEANGFEFLSRSKSTGRPSSGESEITKKRFRKDAFNSDGSSSRLIVEVTISHAHYPAD